MPKRKLPELEAVNRHGARFGRSRATTTYKGSGKKFRSYYRFVCLRCGWHFAGRSYMRHTMDECDLVLAQWTDRDTRAYCRRNLYG